MNIQTLINIKELGDKSGFFDLPKQRTCKDKQHNPPSHFVIPQGKGYKHVCPTCGNVVTIIPNQITM